MQEQSVFFLYLKRLHDISSSLYDVDDDDDELAWKRTGANLEEGVENSLRRLAEEFSELFFDLFYVTDELLLYALKHEGHVGEFALNLACLAYSLAFRNGIFEIFAGVNEAAYPQVLREMVKQMDHFLAFFPPNKKVLNPLRELQNSLAPVP